MRQTHVPGEKLFVDYSGTRMPIVDPKTGELRWAELFIAVFGASNYTFAEATWTQAAGLDRFACPRPAVLRWGSRADRPGQSEKRRQESLVL